MKSSPFICSVLAACAATVALAACGSSSDDGGAATSATSSTQASAFPALVAPVEKLQQRPTSIGITEPVGAPVPRDKTIAYIQCGAPACATNGEFLREAFTTLGWTMKAINAGGTPETIKAAYAQAVREQPDAVVGTGFPRVLFANELAQLVKARIPVIQAYMTDRASEGVDVVAGPQMIDVAARQVADYVLANATSRDMEIGVIYTSSFPSLKLGSQSFRAEIEANCPDCKIQELDVPGTSIGSDLPTRASTFLAAHPKIEWAYVGYADMVVGLPSALQGAGIDNVKLVTNNVNTTVSGYMKNRQMLQAGLGVQTPEVYWRMADLLARQFAGRAIDLDTDDATLPYWTVTGANVPSTTASFPGVVDYRSQYEKLWGIG